MSRGKQVPGFDYTTGKQVSMTAAEWREKYPRNKYLRSTGIPGETGYFLHDAGQAVRRVAEAYAIIPGGK